MLDYKQEIPAMTDLLALYSSVGWTNYTNNPTMLEEAVKASLWQLAVYDKEELALGTFPNVYQRLLVTERSEKNLAFYQSLGFVELSEQACTGMIYKY